MINRRRDGYLTACGLTAARGQPGPAGPALPGGRGDPLALNRGRHGPGPTVTVPPSQLDFPDNDSVKPDLGIEQSITASSVILHHESLA